MAQESNWKMEQWPPEGWDMQAAQDMEDLRNGKVPRVMHWPTEILTIEQLVEKYGYALTEEQIQMLKDNAEKEGV